MALVLAGINFDLTTMIIILCAVGAVLFAVLYFTKKVKIQTVDKMKIISAELVRSNQFNYANQFLFIIRNGNRIFRIITSSFFKFRGERVYFFNVKSLLPGTTLPNPLSKTYILIVSEKNFQIGDGENNTKNIVLNYNFTLQNFYNIIFNSTDLSYEYIEEFSRMIDKNIVDSAFYAQIQRNTVVTFGTPAKDLGEKTNVQLDEAKIKNLAG